MPVSLRLPLYDLDQTMFYVLLQNWNSMLSRMSTAPDPCAHTLFISPSRSTSNPVPLFCIPRAMDHLPPSSHFPTSVHATSASTKSSLETTLVHRLLQEALHHPYAHSFVLFINTAQSALPLSPQQQHYPFVEDKDRSLHKGQSFDTIHSPRVRRTWRLPNRLDHSLSRPQLLSVRSVHSSRS